MMKSEGTLVCIKDTLQVLSCSTCSVSHFANQEIPTDDLQVVGFSKGMVTLAHPCMHTQGLCTDKYRVTLAFY